MNRKTHPNRLPGDHIEAEAANARPNPVAAFRALLQRMGRSAAGTDRDRKVRRGSGAAGGPSRRGGGSHLATETDDAVEASTSGDGDRGQERDEDRALLGEGEAGESIRQGPSFLSALKGVTGADESRDPGSISFSTPFLPPVWPVAAVRGSWKRADPPLSPYAPPADPTQAGQVLAAFRRWGRAASIQPYAPPPFAATAVARSRYLPFAPPLHASIATMPALPREVTVRWRTLAASVRPFVPSNTSALAPRRGSGYRPFTPPLRVAAPDRATRYSPFTPPMAPAAQIEFTLPRSLGLMNRIVASMRPYESPGPFLAARIKGVERRSYIPPPRPTRGIEVAQLLGLGAGDGRRPPMSIDALLASLGSGVVLIAARGAAGAARPSALPAR